MPREVGGCKAGATMTDPGDRGPRLTERARLEKEERQRRLAEAMRANLRRRKAQTRGRGPAGPVDVEPAPEDS
jgi:hypothetical protein